MIVSKRCSFPLPRRRQAMTLIEILVVVAIIGILTAMAAWAAFAMIGNRQRSNTETNFQVLNRLLQDRWTAVITDAKKESPSQAILTLAGGDVERARVMWVKVRLCEAFPVTFAEVDPKNPNSIVNKYIAGQPGMQVKPYFSKYQSVLANFSITTLPYPNPPPPPVPTESSALLLLALNTLQAGGVSISDQLKNGIADTDGDGQPELIDGWGKAIAFFRFPWNNADLQASKPNAANITAQNFTYADPIDASGTLINMGWYRSTLQTPPNPPPRTFESTFHAVAWKKPAPLVYTPVPAGTLPSAIPLPPAPLPNPPPSLLAFYVTPVIVSAGPDGKFGLSAVPSAIPSALLQEMSIANPQDALDNIYSYKVHN